MTLRSWHRIALAAFFALVLTSGVANAENASADAEDNYNPPATPAQPEKRNRQNPGGKKPARKYFHENEPRTDAGIFHAGFAAGGNFYIEPEIGAGKVPTGNYFKDLGFQAGAYFDYDYSELDENIPLMLRGMVGYKYILSSVHVFTFDGMVRRMFRFSEKASFGIGFGASAAVWYRQITSSSSTEQVLFLPSMLVGAGFEFNPFMVDFKWLLNRIGQDYTIMGVELYFGFRL